MSVILRVGGGTTYVQLTCHVRLFTGPSLLIRRVYRAHLGHALARRVTYLLLGYKDGINVALINCGHGSIRLVRVLARRFNVRAGAVFIGAGARAATGLLALNYYKITVSWDACLRCVEVIPALARDKIQRSGANQFVGARRPFLVFRSGIMNKCVIQRPQSLLGLAIGDPINFLIG